MKEARNGENQPALLHTECDCDRRHCCLALGSGEWLVRDLGSTNGTRINGLLIKDGLLRPGDVLGIAHLRFRLVLSDPAKSDPAGDVSREPEPDPANLVLETTLDTALPNLEHAGGEIPRPG